MKSAIVILRRVRREAVLADARELVSTLGEEELDIGISSECLEHAPAHGQAVSQRIRVLEPGGRLALSTPNRREAPAAKAAPRQPGP